MGKVLLESTLRVEDMKSPAWRSRVGEPTVWIQASGRVILLNGQPASGTVLLGYIQTPDVMVNPTDTPDERIPEAFHQYLKYGAAAYLLTLSGQAADTKKASEMYTKFVVGLGLGPLGLASTDVKR
jgi:hypothetical protein